MFNGKRSKFYLMYSTNAVNIINLVVWIIEGLLYVLRTLYDKLSGPIVSFVQRFHFIACLGL